MSRSECACCGEIFTSISSFDLHRIGRFEHRKARRCMTIREMQARGVTRNERGMWTTPMTTETAPWYTSTEERRARRKGGGRGEFL